MNTLLNTPIKIKASSEYNFDDKVIMVFTVILSMLVLLAILLLDVIGTLNPT